MCVRELKTCVSQLSSTHVSLLINSSTVQCRCLPRATSATGRATLPGTAVSAVGQEAVDPVAVCGMEVAAVECVAIVKSATNVINLGTLHALAPRRRSAAIAATALATSPRIAPRRTIRPVIGATSPAIGCATAPRQLTSAARAVAAAAVDPQTSHAISATAPDTSPRTARRRQRLAMAVARADI